MKHLLASFDFGYRVVLREPMKPSKRTRLSEHPDGSHDHPRLISATTSLLTVRDYTPFMSCWKTVIDVASTKSVPLIDTSEYKTVDMGFFYMSSNRP